MSIEPSPHTAAAAPFDLTYERPLAPGELRLHATPDALTLRWTEPRPNSRRNLVKASLWTLAYLCFLAYQIWKWQETGFRWSGLVPVAIIGVLTLGIVLRFAAYAATFGEARSIVADRENIVFLEADGAGGGIPQSRVSHFDTIGRPGGLALRLFLRQRPEDVVRWYHIRWERPNLGPFDLVVHTDRQLVESAAAKLNALLPPTDTPSVASASG